MVSTASQDDVPEGCSSTADSVIPNVPESLHREPDAKLATLMRELRALCANVDDASRYKESKFDTLKRNWAAVTTLVKTGDVHADLQFLELHISENCQLACSYCRGGLRELPTEEKTLAIGDLFSGLDEILITNPHLFVRVSGTIGDPP